MVDSFYDNYTKALGKQDVGKYTRCQLICSWILFGLLIASGITTFVFAELKNADGSLISGVVYIVSAIVLHKLLDWFDKKRSQKLEISAHKERKKAMIDTIDKYFGQGKYGDKIDYFVSLYEKAIKHREEREKLFRRIGLAVITVTGTIGANAINAPENTLWQMVFTVAITAVVLIGLAIAPFYFPAAFDQKKKVYYYMIVELQAVKFIMDSKFPDEKKQKNVKNASRQSRQPNKVSGHENSDKRKQK